MVSRIFRPPALGRLRLASVEDAPAILELVGESMERNFRVHNTSDIVYLIENCIVSICQLDINDTIVGFLSAKDYPLLPSVHPRAWEEYIWTKYKAIELNARNTLFLHLLCWNPVYARELVDGMLRSLFMHDPHVRHVAMLKPLIAYPLLVPGQSRSEGSFRRVAAMERGTPGDLLPALSVADRSEVSPRLRIRRAVEEDNDDIVPILERHSERLREMYGEFYVSELISRHPESERVLMVCEHKELAVGVMCLNTQINYEALEESFELSAFGGLRHLDDCVGTKHSKEMDSMTSASTNAITVSDMHSSSHQMDVKSKDGKSRVTWLFNEDEFKDLRTDSHGLTPTNAPPAILDILHLLEDEDEIEYDIVNIDTDLLRMHKVTEEPVEKGSVDSNMKPLYEQKSKVNASKKSTLTIPQSVMSHKQLDPDPIRYSGTPNAFLLELFAMHPDYDERYGFDMLEAAYELFPDCDYCVMCLPSHQPSFPLLEHFTLVTPYSSRMRFINETLYVAHINSVRGIVAARRGEASDLACLGSLLEHAPRAAAIAELFEAALHSHTLSPFVLLSQRQPVGLVVLGIVAARRGEASDLASLGLLLEHAPRAAAIAELFEAALHSHTLSPFVLLSQRQPVGLVVLGPLEGGTSVRTQYDLEPEPRRSGTDGNILAGVMSPALEPHGRWYMRDVLRQTHYTTLFWVCRLFAKGDGCPGRNLMSLAGHMTPVRPRQAVPNISGNKDLDKIYQELTTPFALWVMERPLTWLPKVFVNNSIVVVGASRTGLSFIESLIMGPASQYLTFSNITLVSEHGLPAAAECARAAETCVPREGRYADRYLKSVPFYFYVDVMTAVMTAIDRKMKCIHLKGGGVKFYDELVLACGKQFQHPDYLHESLELVKEVEKGKPCDRILMDNPEYQPDRVPAPPESPENLMLVNSVYEANSSLKKLLRMIADAKDTTRALSESYPVVVYGECVEAYNCLASLLELGLSARVLAFAEAFPPERASALRVNCFNDETVDERVQSSIAKLGVRVIRRCWLAGWRQVDSRIDYLKLMTPLHAIRLPCFAFFYYGLKAIDINAFRAINESGLVYDGGLIVGPSFETNDPHIFGAGSCTRYSRQLYAERLEHHYYSSEDIGDALGRIFLRKLDPFVMCDPNAEDPSTPDILSRFSSSMLAWQPVTKFESPIVQFSTMPGPLYYMIVRRPGPLIPMEVQLSLPHQGHTLMTDKRGNYFRLQLNVLHCVEAVTCLSKKSFSPLLLGQLYGKHEAFFNKLLARYMLGEIEDLYEYFTQPWMAAMYQETFSDLLRDINEQDVGTVYDLVKSQYSMASKSQSQASSCASACEMGYKDAKNLGTFRSVIDKFVARTSSLQIVNIKQPVDIPSECGQSAFVRGEAMVFWRVVGGEHVVMAHLARYTARHSVANPHYARPNPALFE